MEGNRKMGMVWSFTDSTYISIQLEHFSSQSLLMQCMVMQVGIDPESGTIADVACEVEITE
jgi:hypothetical protein